MCAINTAIGNVCLLSVIRCGIYQRRILVQSLQENIAKFYTSRHHSRMKKSIRRYTQHVHENFMYTLNIKLNKILPIINSLSLEVCKYLLFGGVKLHLCITNFLQIMYLATCCFQKKMKIVFYRFCVTIDTSWQKAEYRYANVYI